MSIRTRWGLATTVLAVAVLVSACAPPAISVPFAAQPVITPQQARATFLQLESERTVAVHDENKAALARIEFGQALTEDDGEIDAEKATGQSDDASALPFTKVSMLVPRLTSYPAWFATETSERGHSALAVVSRPDPAARWRIQFETVLGQPLPAIKGEAGYATAGTLDRNLSSDLARYYANGLLQKPTQFVLPGPDSSKVVSLRQELSSLQSSGWSLDTKYSAGPFAPAQGLALKGGGTLGMATLSWTISVTEADGSCFWQDPRTSYWSYLGSSDSVSRLSYTRVWSAPVIESKAGERVLGLDTEETAEDQVPC